LIDRIAQKLEQGFCTIWAPNNPGVEGSFFFFGGAATEINQESKAL
jgi:hypothetical protein